MKVFCPRCSTAIVVSSHELEKACPVCQFQFQLTQLDTQQVSGQVPVEIDYTGETIGQYRVEEVLGHGGMGTVYRARRGDDNGSVALKILNPLYAANSAFVKRFQREADILQRLLHPNIVRFFEAGQVDGVFYYAMEYVEGLPLDRHLATWDVSMESKLRLAVEICLAVAHAHAAGVVHRDIKPSNILVTQTEEQQTVKLVDFGIAHLACEDDGKTQLTTTNAVLGTYNYMSPEQRLHPSAVTERSDVYSFGVVLYQMFTGRLPMGAFPRPRRLVAGLPKVLDELVMRCLQPLPQDRFPSAGACLGALQQSLTPTTIRPRAARFGIRAAALAVGALLLVGLWGGDSSQLTDAVQRQRTYHYSLDKPVLRFGADRTENGADAKLGAPRKSEAERPLGPAKAMVKRRDAASPALTSEKTRRRPPNVSARPAKTSPKKYGARLAKKRGAYKSRPRKSAKRKTAYRGKATTRRRSKGKKPSP